MPNPIVAVAGIGAGTSLIGASKSSSAVKSASRAQTQAGDAALAEQLRQLEAVLGHARVHTTVTALAGVAASVAHGQDQVDTTRFVMKTR